MPRTYEMADGSAMNFMQQVLRKVHPELKEAKVNIDMEFVEGEEGAPAVKEGGYDTFGKVKIFNEADRKGGSPDARMLIDKTVWEQANADQREGIVDHLLQRLEVRKTEKGEIIRDSTGRPKMNRRKYDIRLAGFSVVAERNGENAPEVMAAKDIRDKYGQLLMWAMETEASG